MIKDIQGLEDIDIDYLRINMFKFIDDTMWKLRDCQNTAMKDLRDNNYEEDEQKNFSIVCSEMESELEKGTLISFSKGSNDYCLDLEITVGNGVTYSPFCVEYNYVLYKIINSQKVYMRMFKLGEEKNFFWHVNRLSKA